MLKSYLVVAWRNLMKNKVFSLINVMGITIGITVCMMIFLFIMNEYSVDRFHANGDRIYRLMRSSERNDPGGPYISGPYATALQNEFPGDIQMAVRVMSTDGMVAIGDKAFSEKKLYVADPGFFKLFSFRLLKGDPASVLKDPSSIVLTESTAKKYFGDEDPMGKVIELSKTFTLKVTGITADPPANSHLDFNAVMPMTNYYNADWFSVWDSNSMFLYLQLANKGSKARVESGLPGFISKYMGEALQRRSGKLYLSLAPLKGIYFAPAPSFDHVRHGDKRVVNIFLSIAILILLIACINFINLSTVRAVERSREVGLRKVIGAPRRQLIWQFIGESLMLTVISCALALGLLKVLMPLYNELLGYTLSVTWNAAPIYLFLAGTILVVGLLAGSYPAFFLSAFSPIEALKGKLRTGKSGSLFRQALVVVQFSISVFLIIGTIVIAKQMNFVKNKDLGYNSEQTVMVRIDNDDIWMQRRSFKRELENNVNIAGVALMSGEPGGFYDEFTFRAEGRGDELWKARTVFGDFEYISTLGLRLIAGRNFSSQLPTDSSDAVIINRTAAASLGYTPGQALGKWILNTYRDSTRRTIIGVIEDFNFLSLKEKMDPLVIAPGRDNRVVAIKVKAGRIKPALAAIREVYSRVAPVYPFEYTFLDDKFAEMYKTDLSQQKILGIFSGLAILIACLGLFGLASFTVAKRIREVGVRKVLGSSVGNIVVLLSRDLLKPVLLAAVIAIPLAYYAMRNWLQNFEYRTAMSWWVFALAAFVTIVIALFTVSFKAVRAAQRSPVKSLRTE